MVPLLKMIFCMSALLLACCEGYRCGEAQVVDKVTKEPIDSVFCQVLAGYGTAYTDSFGLFNICNPFGGCMPCKAIKIRFTKSGYDTLDVKNPDYQSVIYLVPR